jgi:hypothetical protein
VPGLSLLAPFERGVLAVTPWWIGLLELLLAATVALIWLGIAAILVALPIIGVRHLLWLRRERRRA